MKITVNQIRKIIKEEMGQMTQAPRKPGAGAVAKSPNRNLRMVPGKKTKGGGSSLPSLEYPKDGKPLKIGPLKVIFWMSPDKPETVWANWEGAAGSGNDSIEDLASILDDMLQGEAEDARADLEDTLSYVRELFGVE